MFLSEDAYFEEFQLTIKEQLSSSIRKFRAYGTITMPTNSWTLFGEYEMPRDEDQKSFKINKPQLVRYVKIEILSIHEDSYYYCTITKLSVFGKTLLDLTAYQNDSNENVGDSDTDTSEKKSKGESRGKDKSSNGKDRTTRPDQVIFLGIKLI
jgi:hypothetical protein